MNVSSRKVAEFPAALSNITGNGSWECVYVHATDLLITRRGSYAETQANQGLVFSWGEILLIGLPVLALLVVAYYLRKESIAFDALFDNQNDDDDDDDDTSSTSSDEEEEEEHIHHQQFDTIETAGYSSKLHTLEHELRSLIGEGIRDEDIRKEYAKLGMTPAEYIAYLLGPEDEGYKFLARRNLRTEGGLLLDEGEPESSTAVRKSILPSYESAVSSGHNRY